MQENVTISIPIILVFLLSRSRWRKKHPNVGLIEVKTCTFSEGSQSSLTMDPPVFPFPLLSSDYCALSRPASIGISNPGRKETQVLGHIRRWRLAADKKEPRDC